MAVLAGKNDFSDQNVSPTYCPGEDLEPRSLLEDMLDYESEHQSTRKRTDEDYTTLISGQKLQDPGKDQQMILADLMNDPLPFEDLKRQSPIYDSSLCPVDYQPYVGTSEPQDSDLMAAVQLRSMVQTKDKEFGEKLWLNAKNHSPPQIPPQIVDDGALKNPVSTDQEKAAVQERRRKRVSVFRDTKSKNVYVRKMYLGKPREREIEVLSKLKHRSIPVLYDAQKYEDHTILCMEYCGEPLSTYVQHYYDKDSHVPEDCVSDILEQLLDLQSYLQLAKVRHQNISAETLCIQRCRRKGLIVKLVGFGKVLTYQDSTIGSPELDQASSHADMLACGRVAIFMTYGPKFFKENTKILGDELRNHFPKMYSADLKNLVLKMVDENVDPTTFLDEIHKKRQQQVIELSDSDEEVLQLSSNVDSGYQPLTGVASSYSHSNGVDDSYPPSTGVGSGYPPSTDMDVSYSPSTGVDVSYQSSTGMDDSYPPSTDVGRGYPPSTGVGSGYPPSTGIDVSYPPSTGGDTANPPMSVYTEHQAPFQKGKNITFLEISKDLPIITPPSNRSDASVLSQSLSGYGGTVGFNSDRQDNVIAVNPGASLYGEPEKVEVVSLKKKQQADPETLGKIKSLVVGKQSTREKPYIRPQTKFTNLPNFDKIEK